MLYKLLEGSWEDDAVIRDVERGIYADPAKIHDIDHVGEFYDVVGPHLVGALAAAHAGALPGRRLRGGTRLRRAQRGGDLHHRRARPRRARTTSRTCARAPLRAGRDPEDMLFFQGLSFVVGGTEEEARRKARELEETASARGYAAHMGGGMGVDLAEIDLDTPIGELEQYNSPGHRQGR